MTDRARLARVTVYPFKSLDGLDRPASRIVESGALAGDREFAAFDADGEYVNGKRERRVHRIRAAFGGPGGADEPDEGDEGDEPGEEPWRRVTLRPADADPVTVRLGAADGRARAGRAFEEYLGYPVTVRRDGSGGFPDDQALSGPTLVSTATIREVASWFDGVDEAGMRRRLRANLEVDGVPAFWEDRLFADRGEGVAFEVGGTRFVGVNPCQRCVVPSRDPDTGEAYPGFRERFVEKRRETKPPWTDGERFDHDFRLMLNTVVPASTVGERVAVDDEVRVGETVPVDA
ncbi:MOSC domain-containing protein [Halobium salinum]|uniref:MOSC domain-containing protein n=1 Tax=Halobium salinum TaxID=1364940 RepID=A0ABD5PDW7_9EURY|nr:MOSC N-terminal beta barrel domain-containing protein [Halobium salinum]